MKLRNILHDVLNEALSLKQAKEYQSIVRSSKVDNRISSIFNALEKDSNYVTKSKRGDRLYFNVDFESPKNLPSEGDPSVEYTGDMYDTFNKVRMFLTNNGYEASLSDYKQGITFDENGRSMKIGKLIVKVINTTKPSESAIKTYKELLSSFEKDKIRSKVSTSKLYIVVSKAKYDIAGMSTGRGWESCMSLNGGSNMNYVSCDVKEGALISYLISKDDMNIQNPISRINIKPYINTSNSSDIVYIPEDSIYGIDIQGFYKSLSNIFESIQPEAKGVFKLHDDLYSDNPHSVIKGEVAPIIDGNNAKQFIDTDDDELVLMDFNEIKQVKDINLKEVVDIKIWNCGGLQTVNNVVCKGTLKIVKCDVLTSMSSVSSNELDLNGVSALKEVSGKTRHLKLYNIEESFLNNCDLSNLDTKLITITLFKEFKIPNFNLHSNVDIIYIEDHRTTTDALELSEKIGSGNVKVYITRNYAPKNSNVATYPDNKNYKVLKNQ